MRKVLYIIFAAPLVVCLFVFAGVYLGPLKPFKDLYYLKYVALQDPADIAKDYVEKKDLLMLKILSNYINLCLGQR